MDKDKRIGVRRKPAKRRSSKGLAKAVADYLASDCYMYAPLVDAPPSDSSPDSAAGPHSSADLPGPCSEIRTHRRSSFHTESISIPSVHRGTKDCNFFPSTDSGLSVVNLRRLPPKY
ncbi:hypothetical protein ZIOFF_072022 [Zingiber officinale]|uniref:Uncharacterized protein n=1 Tax=Zingiber officinale TaxID=94328 RepID=A0A8J5C9I3_ZINOF|nr:hypothetical protein ZIOFF_072022 [Zingiber officinale]